MRTIGKLIKESRLKKRYSLKRVESETKIKAEFVEGIESENWKILPDFSVVSGFVKSLTNYLSIDEKTALALLRRDYPPKNISINPKPDVGSRFFWNPRLTFLTSISLMTIAILGYLGFQYNRFISPPTLSVGQPKEGQIVNERSLLVSGRTDTDAVVSVNNQPVIVDSDGNFATTIEISEKTNEVDVLAKSRAGRETIVKRRIKVELKNLKT